MLVALEAKTGFAELPGEETLPWKIGSLLLCAIAFVLCFVYARNEDRPPLEPLIMIVILPFVMAYYVYLIAHDLTLVFMHYIRRYRKHKNTLYQ